jgi:hypothetical protein
MTSRRRHAGLFKWAGTVIGCLLLTAVHSQYKQNERHEWLLQMDKLARPVIANLAANTLKQNMTVNLSALSDNPTLRKQVSYLEAFGRTLSGIGPWLNIHTGDVFESGLRDQYRNWAVLAIKNAVDPEAKDYLKWDGGQPLVDASFLALGLVRCPWLWHQLDSSVKQQVVDAFKTTRRTLPAYSNWLLFSALIEAFFCKYGYEYDRVRIDYAVREFANHWYVGDGMFSDGMNFHMDYYNSIVIHPYLAAIIEIVNEKDHSLEWFSKNFAKINSRFAEIQERTIGSDGSYPVIGRSIVYRGGVFHQLADIAYRKQLPPTLKPGQIRPALTAVINKTLKAGGTYDKDGWLVMGVAGSQPGLADTYITTGSLYICANIFLPLGLAADDEFWTAPAEPWTSAKVWSGQDAQADHAMDIH